MAGIIPRGRPEVAPINSLAQVRNTATVRPVDGLTETAGQFGRIAVEHAERLQEQEDVTALMAARKELSDWEASTFDPENAEGIGAYKGQNALKANEKLIPDLDRRMAEIGTRLSPRQKARFDDLSLSFRDSVQGRLNGHMQREHEAYRSAEQKAAVSNLTNDATQAALEGDFGLASTRATELLDMQRAALTADGMPEELIKAAERETVSGIHAQVVAGMLATDPHQAQAYFDRYEGMMSAVDRTRALNELRPYVEDVDAETAASNALAGVSGGTLASREPEAVQTAFRGLAQANGTHITSAKRPVLKVGAGERSQHPAGTAADFSVKGMERAQIDKLIADGRAAGFEVIDESDGKTGTGPHIHMELPPGAAVGGTDDGKQRETLVLGHPASEGEALERVRNDPTLTNPRVRKLAEQKVREQWSQREQDKADAERNTREAINAAVWSADPKQSLRQILGPQYQFAAEKGMLGGLSQDLLLRRNGGDATRTDDKAVVGAYLDALRSNPKAFATMDVMKNARHMSPKTVDELVAMQQQVRDGKFDTDEYATEAEQLKALVYAPLGVTGDSKKDKETRAKFEAQWFQTKRDYVKATGKQPTAEQREGLIKRLNATVLLGGDEVPLYQADEQQVQVPPAIRSQIVDALTRKGKKPDDATILRLYLLHTGNQ